MVQQKVDLKEMMAQTQRDFEIAVLHTKTLINKQKEAQLSNSRDVVYSYQGDVTNDTSVEVEDKNATSTSQSQSQSRSKFESFRELQKQQVLSYLESKLRVIKLLNEKTFPPKRNLIQEAVSVMQVPENIRDCTPKKASFKQIISGLSSPKDRVDVFSSKSPLDQKTPVSFMRSAELSKQELIKSAVIESVAEDPNDQYESNH